MRQYVLIYKHNKSVIGFFCTKEAAWDRMNYLTDTNDFGVFEIEVSLSSDLSKPEYIFYGVVINQNNSLLQVYIREHDVSETSKYLISTGFCRPCAVQYKIVGKEIKRPKKDDEI